LKQFALGTCKIYLDNENKTVTTVFDDGTQVVASPNYRKEDIDKARELGYNGDTWRMSRVHELMHTWLSVKAGGTRSPTLWSVPNRDKPEASIPETREFEEWLVCEFQKYLNGIEPNWKPLFVLTGLGFDLEELKREALNFLGKNK
jgi:hypothetical protein